MSKATQCVNGSPYYFNQRKTPTQSSLSRQKAITVHIKKKKICDIVSISHGWSRGWSTAICVTLFGIAFLL